jgi:hypothetical protein
MHLGWSVSSDSVNVVLVSHAMPLDGSRAHHGVALLFNHLGWWQIAQGGLVHLVCQGVSRFCCTSRRSHYFLHCTHHDGCIAPCLCIYATIHTLGTDVLRASVSRCALAASVAADLRKLL